jgi:hypothetical protein
MSENLFEKEIYYPQFHVNYQEDEFSDFFDDVVTLRNSVSTSYYTVLSKIKKNLKYHFVEGIPHLFSVLVIEIENNEYFSKDFILLSRIVIALVYIQIHNYKSDEHVLNFFAENFMKNLQNFKILKDKSINHLITLFQSNSEKINSLYDIISAEDFVGFQEAFLLSTYESIISFVSYFLAYPPLVVKKGFLEDAVHIIYDSLLSSDQRQVFSDKVKTKYNIDLS